MIPAAPSRAMRRMWLCGQKRNSSGAWLTDFMDKAFQCLIDAVRGRIDAGCDVRLITSQYRHNWSGDRKLRNRDATLIIHNQEAAQYFERIFLGGLDYARPGEVNRSID